MINTQDWLPIGSVVHVEGAQTPFMVIACMVSNEDGALWDYAGVPYPQGLANEDDTVLFDRDGIDGIYYLGFQNEDGEGYRDALRIAEADYLEAKQEGAGGVGHGDES